MDCRAVGQLAGLDAASNYVCPGLRAPFRRRCWLGRARPRRGSDASWKGMFCFGEALSFFLFLCLFRFVVWQACVEVEPEAKRQDQAKTFCGLWRGFRGPADSGLWRPWRPGRRRRRLYRWQEEKERKTSSRICRLSFRISFNIIIIFLIILYNQQNISFLFPLSGVRITEQELYCKCCDIPSLEDIAQHATLTKFFKAFFTRDQEIEFWCQCANASVPHYLVKKTILLKKIITQKLAGNAGGATFLLNSSHFFLSETYQLLRGVK